MLETEDIEGGADSHQKLQVAFPTGKTPNQPGFLHFDFVIGADNIQLMLRLEASEHTQ